MTCESDFKVSFLYFLCLSDELWNKTAQFIVLPKGFFRRKKKSELNLSPTFSVLEFEELQGDP